MEKAREKKNGGQSVKKCPICGKAMVDSVAVEGHLGRMHPEQLGDSSPRKFLFDLRNGKSVGTCIMRGKIPGCLVRTDFNERMGKYARLCSNPGCKEGYVAEFRKRMLARYGKTHLLDDEAVQRQMLAGRSISGTYRWRDGSEFTYTGSYEREFLEFMDLVMEWPASDIVVPAPFSIDYEIGGTRHTYIPDAYIPSADLVVEVKGSNGHYQTRDSATERAKDDAAARSGHNYQKILDHDYGDFIEGLAEGRWSRGGER